MTYASERMRSQSFASEPIRAAHDLVFLFLVDPASYQVDLRDAVRGFKRILLTTGLLFGRFLLAVFVISR